MRVGVGLVICSIGIGYARYAHCIGAMGTADCHR